MALPVTLVGVFVGLLPSFSLLPAFGTIGTSLAFIASVISVVGYFVMLYVVNLRLDVVLYARAVNGIRKYFYDKGLPDLSYKLRMRVLPQSPTQPSYLEHSYFWPVIATFAFFNSTYLIMSLTLPTLSNSSGGFSLQSIHPLVWVAGAAFGLWHYVSYRLYAHHREHGYLRSFILGVDIDGVLNLHRTKFAEKLHELTGKSVDPERMTTIPLHDDPSIGVDREDEKRIFNTLDYWTDMPVMPQAKDVLRKLRKQFKLKIHIFTYRPWPTEPVVRGSPSFKLWQEKAVEDLGNILPHGAKRHLIPHWIYAKIGMLRIRYGRKKLFLDPIDVVTRSWLEVNEIVPDKFTLEKGNEDVEDPQGHTRNRFNISRKKNIRFFVEDDADKAAKLSFICDVVFLLDQPYNTWKTVPTNVVRARSWDDIYKSLKRLI
jgi:uncharacterized HAD superfamily protein